MDYVNDVLKMADPEKKTSVNLKKLTEAEEEEEKRKNKGLLMSIGCRTEGKRQKWSMELHRGLEGS